jgi:hypothetical protein
MQKILACSDTDFDEHQISLRQWLVDKIVGQGYRNLDVLVQLISQLSFEAITNQQQVPNATLAPSNLLMGLLCNQQFSLQTSIPT